MHHRATHFALDVPTVIAATILPVAACSTPLSPEDPADIGSWMELYEVPGVSVAVIRDFEVEPIRIHAHAPPRQGELCVSTIDAIARRRTYVECILMLYDVV